MALRRYIVWCIILCPAILALGLIVHFSVDVPFWDEWIVPMGMYSQIIEGNLDFYDHLFSQYNESIEPIPRLILLGVGFTLGWHGPFFMVLSWSCALVTLLIILKFLPRKHGQSSMGFLCIGLLLSALLFSSSQFVNWLFGIQFIVFIPPLCLAGCLWVQFTRASFGRIMGTCALLSCISTFSYPNGMLCWLLGFPFLKVLALDWKTVSPRQRREVISWLCLYLAFMVVTLGLYFWDYKNPPQHPSFSVALENPLFGLEYFAAWIGGPFVPQTLTFFATVLGTGILGLVFVSFARVLVEWTRTGWSEDFTALYPWSFLIAYGILTGVVTTLGRSGFGLASAIAPRYVTFSLWVTIGLVGLLYTLWYHKSMKYRVVDSILFQSAMLIIALLTTYSWLYGYEEMQFRKASQRQNLLTVRLLDVAPSNPLMSRAHWDPVGASTRGRQLMKHGILPIEPIGSWLTEKLNAPDGQAAGSFFIVTEERKNVVMGWAKLPSHELPADCVILARRLLTGKPAVITGFITTLQGSKEVVIGPWSQTAVSEFHETFDFPYAQGDQWTMFAVNLQTQRVYELQEDSTQSRVLSYPFLAHIKNAKRLTPQPDFVGTTLFVIHNQDRKVLFEHPNSEVLFNEVPIAKGTQLEFGIGINEPAWEQSGDGVLFEVFLQDEHGKDHHLFSQWVDPKNNPEDRRWFDQLIDLKAFSGQTVSFRFKTSGGADNDLAYDWAGWSTPRIIVNPESGAVSSSL